MKTIGRVFEFFAMVLLLVIAGFVFVALSMDMLNKFNKFFPSTVVVYAVYGETDCELAVDVSTGDPIPCDQALAGGRYDKVYIAPKSLRTAE